MKKGKVFGKTQIALAVMVMALGAAVWLNMKYSTVSTKTDSGTSSKYLGQAEYVNAETELEENPVEEYFLQLKKERKQARDEAVGIIEESLAGTSLSADDREKLIIKTEQLAERSEKEAAIETVLKAKGFNNVIAIIGDDDINIVTVSEGLQSSEMAQIRDAVMAQTDFHTAKIKIVTMTEQEVLSIEK